MEILRTSPDYVVIDHETKVVRLIEVKYRRILVQEETCSVAKRMKDSWNPSYLFVATPTGFFFDSVEEIIARGGEMSSLSTGDIPMELQEKFLRLLNRFEGNS